MGASTRGVLIGVATAALALLTATDAMAQGRGRDRGSRGRGADNAPRVGQAAPDFKLKQIDVAKGTVLQDPETKKDVEVKLSDVLKAEKPVALIFGSYT